MHLLKTAWSGPWGGTARDLWAAILAAALPLVCACGGVSGPNGGNGGDGGNGIDRSVLSVRVEVDPEHDELAAVLGWEGGAVAGAEVSLQREASDGAIEDPITATTDSDGIAEFRDLIASTYRLSALRLLSTAEIDVVESERPTLRALGGGRKIGQAAGEVVLEVIPNRTGSLVVSEMSTVDKAVGQNPGGDPTWVGFIELYNNSSETIFLDGKLIGRPFYSLWETQVSCEQKESFSGDAEGVWTRFMQRFPGTGTQYPLGPGETVVIAHDAIDHSEVDPDFLDLSGADFEFDGPADPDNPGVPNLIEESTDPIIGNGIQFIQGAHAPFVASEDVDVSGLPQERAGQPLTDAIYVRIPADDVIDAFAQIFGNLGSTADICSQAIHENFDRLAYVYKRIGADAHLKSQQRKVVGTAPGGWSILLDTNTGAVDFHEASRTPGTLPP